MDFPAGPPVGKRPRGADELAPRRRGKRHEFDDVDDRMDEEEDEEEGPDPLAPRSGAGTDAVVAAALRAEASAKAARQQVKDAEVKGKKAEKKKVSFAKDGDEEGGACEADKKEASKAAAARAVRRKGAKDIGGTEFDEDLAAVEERAAHVGVGAPGDDEGEFEPFNLDEERETGHFDDDGNYVFRKEEKHEEDAWLEGVQVDETMAAKARQAAAEEASKPAHLPDEELGRMQMEIADMLHPNESVLKALKRMSAGAGTAKPTPGGRGRAAPSSAQAVDPAHRAAFERLTELSSTLMAFGEYDVYTFTKEAFLRSARALGAAAVASTAAGPSKASSSMDMFADPDDGQAEPPAKRQATGTVGGAAAGAAAPGASSPPDFGAWGVSHLRRFLELRGKASAAAGAVEKRDLVAAVQEEAAAAGLQVPPGYSWDSTAGVYTNPEGMSYDLATCAFGNASGEWFLWDAATQAFVPWKM